MSVRLALIIPEKTNIFERNVYVLHILCGVIFLDQSKVAQA